MRWYVNWSIYKSANRVTTSDFYTPAILLIPIKDWECHPESQDPRQGSLVHFLFEESAFHNSSFWKKGQIATIIAFQESDSWGLWPRSGLITRHDILCSWQLPPLHHSIMCSQGRGLIRDGGTDGGVVLLCSYSLKKTLVSGSILVHAGALFIPLILIVTGCQNDNTYSEAPYFKSVC